MYLEAVEKYRDGGIMSVLDRISLLTRRFSLGDFGSTWIHTPA